MKSIDCAEHSFLDYNVNDPNCITPCNPNASGSACANWNRDLSRVEITTTDVANKKKFRIERVEQSSFLGSCFYHRIYAAADSGCLSHKTYWMTFVDKKFDYGETDVEEIAFLKWYLIPENTTSILAKRAASFKIPALLGEHEDCDYSKIY